MMRMKFATLQQLEGLGAPDGHDALPDPHVGTEIGPADCDVHPPAAEVPVGRYGAGHDEGNDGRPRGTRDPHVQTVDQDGVQDHVDHRAHHLDDHGPPGGTLAAQHPGHHTAENDEEHHQVDRVGICQTVGDGVPGAHQDHGLLRGQKQHRGKYQTDHGGDDHALGSRAVGVRVVLLPDVPGYRRPDADSQTVPYADEDGVDRVDDPQGAHGGAAETCDPEAVHDAVQLLEEEGDAYGDGQGYDALPLVAQEGPRPRGVVRHAEVIRGPV